MASPAVVEKAAAFGSETVSTTPAASRARVAQDVALYGTLIKRNRIAGE